MPPGRPITLRAEDVSRGDPVASFTRAALCVGLVGLEKAPPFEVAQRTFADDRSLELVLRAAVAPTTLSNSPALSTITIALLDALVPYSAGIDLLRRGVQLNFDGAAQISVPGIAIPSASFVGEGQPIPVRQAPTTPGVSLSPHKLATTCSLSGELMRSSNAETLVKQVLIESTGSAIDSVLFSTAAATVSQPAGLLNGITALAASTGGTGANKTDALLDDLKALTAALAPVAGRSPIAFVVNPVDAISLAYRLARPIDELVLASAAVPARTLVGVVVNALASALEGVPQIDANTSAAIHYDTVPGEIVDVGGVRAAPVGSLFQTDEVGLRLRWPLSWALRDSRGVAWIQNINW
jgi:hypothetical protein